MSTYVISQQKPEADLGRYVPGMDGFWDSITGGAKAGAGTAWDWLKTGAVASVQGQQQGGTTGGGQQYQQPGFMDKYGTFIAVGGAALVGVLIYRSMRKRK